MIYTMSERGEPSQRQAVEDFEDIRRRERREEERRKEEEAMCQFMELYKKLRSDARRGKFGERVFACDGPGGKYETENKLSPATLVAISYKMVGKLEEHRAFPGSREIGIQYHPREEYFYPWHDPEKDRGEIYFLELGRTLTLGRKQWSAYLKRHSRKRSRPHPMSGGELSPYALSIEFSEKSPAEMQDEMDLIYLGHPFAYQENEKRKKWWRSQDRPKKKS